ncbi:hypothetical protein B0O80DRAFT_430483 [Mortierella sp. GBAus27b]|nr:hypothetical protein B0O80DRAFT_430483 [Mortierella sp. GBAus27b]
MAPPWCHYLQPYRALCAVKARLCIWELERELELDTVSTPQVRKVDGNDKKSIPCCTFTHMYLSISFISAWHQQLMDEMAMVTGLKSRLQQLLLDNRGLESELALLFTGPIWRRKVIKVTNTVRGLVDSETSDLVLAAVQLCWLDLCRELVTTVINKQMVHHTSLCNPGDVTHRCNSDKEPSGRFLVISRVLDFNDEWVRRLLIDKNAIESTI